MSTHAFKNSRSGYTLGCPRPRFTGSTGIGRRSTSWTNITRNESWGTIKLPPIRVVCNYHNDSGRTSLEQVSSEGLLFMTRPHIIHISSTANYKIDVSQALRNRGQSYPPRVFTLPGLLQVWLCCQAS